ncbi:MAG: type I 3-dehydroquinate dehydratase [Planctomycetota bacterium]|nr:type I 3-dehydroquinate dehydratase [Planctomycetota bacterium]
MAIVVSHKGADFEELSKAALRQAALADLIELRLDDLGDLSEERLAEFVQQCPKPVIAAVHGPEAFGSFTGSIDERLELLRMAARAGCRFVDVDWRLSLELGEVGGKCHRIVSRHELEGTPQDLEAIHEEVRAVLYEGDVVKLVTHANTCEDGLRLLRYLRECGKGLVAFCSGEKGSFTRVLAPILGSPFTYAAAAQLHGSQESEMTAPGQLRVNDLHALAPPGGLSHETAVFGVVGRPIAQSWSPRVHGMALKGAKLDAVYLAFEPDDIAEFLKLADDDCFRGFSITAPFKGGALIQSRSTDSISERAEAANTLVREKDGWRAFNTDVPAIRETLELAMQMHSQEPGRPVALAVSTALVLGTGGAASAACAALSEVGAKLIVAGRDVERARALASRFGGTGIAWDEIESCEHDILIHCTPAGSLTDPGAEPIPSEWIRPNTLVLDGVYRPVKTPLLAAAIACGCTAVPGGEWFVRQAARQYRLFTSQEPDEEMLRAAFRHALDEEDVS